MQQVEFTSDQRVVTVVTKASAPGGKRKERIALPPDPDLFDHLVEHGVQVHVSSDHAARPACCRFDQSRVSFKFFTSRQISRLSDWLQSQSSIQYQSRTWAGT